MLAVVISSEDNIARLDELKEMVEADQYTVNADQVAEKMISSVTAIITKNQNHLLTWRIE